MTKQRYMTGSRAFFDGMDGFEPKDTDLVEFRPTSSVPLIRLNNTVKTTVFVFKGDTAEGIIEYFERHPEPAMQIAMLLSPTIIERVGMKIEHLPRLKPFVDRLDDRHRYLADIYEAYVKNKSFKLYKYQREKALKTYIAARK